MFVLLYCSYKPVLQTCKTNTVCAQEYWCILNLVIYFSRKSRNLILARFKFGSQTYERVLQWSNVSILLVNFNMAIYFVIAKFFAKCFRYTVCMPTFIRSGLFKTCYASFYMYSIHNCQITLLLCCGGVFAGNQH